MTTLRKPSGIDLGGKWRFEQGREWAGVRYVDICLEGAPGYLKPGQGMIDFACPFKRLESGGYRGHYMMAFGSRGDMLARRECLVKTCA